MHTNSIEMIPAESAEPPSVTNAINVFLASTYKSVKTGLFSKSFVTTSGV